MARRPPAVARVLERVTATAREHDMFLPKETTLVAVSGGPDSTCLLYALWHLRRLFRIRLEVFHYDHRLRPESGKDAEYVRRLAARLKVPFHLRVAESGPGSGESVEAWARTRRVTEAMRLRRDIGARRTQLSAAEQDRRSGGGVGIHVDGADAARSGRGLVDRPAGDGKGLAERRVA